MPRRSTMTSAATALARARKTRRPSVETCVMDARPDDASRAPRASTSTSASALDFYSPDFDPALALRKDSGAVPPRPRARALDTVRQCRRLLPSSADEGEGGLGRGRGGARATRDATSFAAQARAKQRAEKFTKQGEKFAQRERVCDVLANSKHARDGPLRVLRDARERRERVKIVTRHARGVRGVATAYVEAFDKFSNMILTDVEETYSVRVMREVEKERTLPSEINGGATTTETKTRILPKLDVRTRRIQQVFVRGEQVVSVSIPPSGA